MSFNPCNVMDIYIDIFSFTHLFASCQPKYNLNLLIASSTVKPYLMRTSFWEFSFGLSIKPRQPQQIVPSLTQHEFCLLYTSPSPRDGLLSRMPSSA